VVSIFAFLCRVHLHFAMAKWSVALVPRADGESQLSVQLLHSLQNQAKRLLSFVVHADPGVCLLTGMTELGCCESLSKLVQRSARRAPGNVSVQLGDVEWRPDSNGQLQLCILVGRSPEVCGLQQSVLSSLNSTASDTDENRDPDFTGAAGSSVDVPCFVLGTTHPSAASAVKQRLQSWWREPQQSGNRTVECDSLFCNGVCQTSRLPLGRAAVVRRGQMLLSGLPAAPQVPQLCRHHSQLPCVAHASQMDGEVVLRRSKSVDVRGDVNSDEQQERRAPARARLVQLDATTWALGLTLSPELPALTHRPPTRFHFVLDNSGSMGQNTERARQCFSQLVDVANGDCSLTVFSHEAVTLGEAFASPAAMCAVRLPPQGRTNISDGVARAVEIITRCEQAEQTPGRTHHVLVLLSDGAHNSGPHPEQCLPAMGARLREAAPSLRLSVAVVGVTGSSNTSMGMLLKQSLETVAIPSLEPIYFAPSPGDMATVLDQMHTGLAALRGGLVRIAANSVSQSTSGLVAVVGEAPAPHLNVIAKETEYAFMWTGSSAPPAVLVDGAFVRCLPPNEQDFDSELVSAALQDLMDVVRLRRVASGAESVQRALQQLSSWIESLEARLLDENAKGDFGGLRFAKAGPSSRVTQHKAAIRVLHGAKELRNQLADIEALRTNDSASQAAFLTGARSKYGAKALRRAAAHGNEAGNELQSTLADVERVSGKMRAALHDDLRAKMNALTQEQRKELRRRAAAELPLRISRRAIDAFCFGFSTEELSEADSVDVGELVDTPAVARLVFDIAGCGQRSYLSMQTPWEQLHEWCEAAGQAASHCRTEYELLMYLGTLGRPIDVKRRAATQMNPYAMEVTRVRAAPVDTASLSCAMYSQHPVVPAEGGLPVEDVLVLIDPDLPKSSRLAAFSQLLGEVYTSVVLCRDLHMYSGRAMRIALHAHSFLSASQPAAPEATKDDLEAQLRRQYLGRAYQCASCNFGPVDHYSCHDLSHHHGESDGHVAEVNNACPHCGWFSSRLSDWPKWDGTVPDQAEDNATARGPAACSAAMVDVALRILYSARATWKPDAEGDAHAFCEKLIDEGAALTTADGVDHPVQILLALAICDDVNDDAFEHAAMMKFINEVCARRARDELKSMVAADENVINTEARRRVRAFLGVTSASAPEAASVEDAEPAHSEVRLGCSRDYDLIWQEEDYVGWVAKALKPWLGSLAFVHKLRQALKDREGGWLKLACDLETNPAAYADVLRCLQEPLGDSGNLTFVLGVEEKDIPRVCATMMAQALLHNASQQRRLQADGGNLSEPLGSVLEGETLENLAVDLRIAMYMDRVALKMQEWRRIGTDITVTRARACDIGQYAIMCTANGSHVHGLSKQAFWGLWHAAKSDGHNGEKVKEFLKTANHGFREKYV